MVKKKNMISIDYDDDNEDYESFNQYMEETTKIATKKIVEEIEEFGDEYLKEIERKKWEENKKKKKLIPYIVKYSEGRYTQEKLLQYTFNDVLEIYSEYKHKNRHPIVKFFCFIFNLE